jgi:hypothetical protein
MKATTSRIATIPLREPLFRGPRRLRIALVGLPNSGKSTFFAAVASTSVHRGALAGTRSAYDECAVQIGLDEARVIDLPSIRSPHHLASDDRAALKYLLWGDERPPVSRHEPDGPPAPFAPPDVIVQVLDATSLEHHLELTLKLAKFERPLVIALNKIDEATERGIYVNAPALSAQLGVPVVPTSAIKGQGIAELFREYNGHCTFFVVGTNVRSHPEAVRTMARLGHDIGNHTLSHPAATAITEATFVKQIQACEQVLNGLGLTSRPWFRFPYFAEDKHLMQIVTDQGYLTVGSAWTIEDTGPNRSAGLSVATVRRFISPGVIFVGHANSMATYGAMKAVLPELARQGYSFVSLSELLRGR